MDVYFLDEVSTYRGTKDKNKMGKL